MRDCQYDALGRQIAATNGTFTAYTAGSATTTSSPTTTGGTQTYYDGANPIVVFQSHNALLERYVWSPADGRLILRDAVAANSRLYMGLSTVQANSSGGIQRLYPLTDAQGSVVAVAAATIADPNHPGSYIATTASNMVQERYTDDVNGLPQSLAADFTRRELSTKGTRTVVIASAANSYSGETDIQDGELQLMKDPTLGRGPRSAWAG